MRIEDDITLEKYDLNTSKEVERSKVIGDVDRDIDEADSVTNGN